MDLTLINNQIIISINMLKEFKIDYKGLTLLVTGSYIKGRGFINYDDEPEEDEFIIDDYNVTDYNSIDDLRDFILSKRLINDREIERICLEKCI